MIQNITRGCFYYIPYYLLCFSMDRNKLPFTEGEEVSHITCDLCTGMGYDLCIASAFPDIFSPG